MEQEPVKNEKKDPETKEKKSVKKEKTLTEKDAGKKKNQRRPRFKPEERAYLVKLVAEYKDILESKVTSRDIKDITRKALAWTEVSAKFNAGCVQAPVTRTTDELKKKWENLKD